GVWTGGGGSAGGRPPGDRAPVPLNKGGWLNSGPPVTAPVPARQWQAAGNLFAQEWNGHVEGRGQGGYLRCLPCLVRNHIPRRRLRQQTRLGANPVDLPLQAQLQLIVGCNVEELEFDARASRVDDAAAIGHP